MKAAPTRSLQVAPGTACFSAVSIDVLRPRVSDPETLGLMARLTIKPFPVLAERGVVGDLRNIRLAAIVIDADVEHSAQDLKRALRANRWESNTYGKSVRVTGDTYYIFRFKGHRWTIVISDLVPGVFDDTLAEGLSRRLKARVLYYDFEDVSMSSRLRLFDSGVLRELMNQFDWPDKKTAKLLSKAEFSRGSFPRGSGAFVYYSDVRRLRRGMLTIDNIEDYTIRFFRDMDALLFLNYEVDRRDGIEAFKLIGVDIGDVERMDLLEQTLT